MLIPEDLLLRDKRLHEGRELLLYKREMEPGSSLQKEKLNHQRTFLVHNVEDRQEQILSQGLRRAINDLFCLFVCLFVFFMKLTNIIKMKGAVSPIAKG